MAYESAHTGPEIDAAVQMLGQVQEAREATKGDLADVKTLAAQVDSNASQVKSQVDTVVTKAEQVSASAQVIEQARSEVVIASATVEEAKNLASEAAGKAVASGQAAALSQQAAANSQVAAGLSEQFTAESAASVEASLTQVQGMAQAVEKESAATKANAEDAALSAKKVSALVDVYGSTLPARNVNDDDFSFSVTDEKGFVSFGVRPDGTFYGAGASEQIEVLQTSTPRVTPIEDTGTIVDGVVDKNGFVGYGVNAYGEFIAAPSPESVSAVSSYVVRGASVSGLTVTLGRSLIRTGDKNFALNAVTLAAATDVTEKVTDYLLAYIVPVSMPITEFLKVDAAKWLGYSSVQIVSVINQADNKELVAGVDYAYTENGKLVRVSSGAALSVTVNFVGHKERYDLIAYNDLTRNVVVRQGTERRITAQEDAYRPKLQQGDIGLYMAYVVGGAIKDLIDISGWRGVRNRATSGEMARLIESNRYRLRRFLCKLNRGEGVIVTGYGDSNTALGGARGTDAAYAPNRAGVDTLAFQGDYLMSAFESDFRDTYLATVGKVTVNGEERYKTSPNWSVIDKIVSGYGYTFAADRVPGAKEVIYLNQGIATTTAGTAGQGGRNPTRLAAMLNPAGFRTPDLVILAFGMNDRTDLTYVNDIEQIVLAIKAAGADVIVVGPHQVGPYSASFTDESWHLVQRRLRECADRLDVAFMPNELFYMGKNRGYLGLSDYSLVRANFANHPGPYEYRKQGEALASCFL
ncbi:SGNH/GDSL hydrolase family protein [Pseudomonas sp. S32]|uniref:SGNH/GDSL hydrolase family protein n=1 Tax=Pseudomonas sp. S32 TaxID=2767448 RepID=UPI0019129204|nr:GDSL-type esterase/lipase family protein [Pseudomonas sp. S32]MBK5004153.1 SGNH/GDSL hydrolase family protein [Pseudomonas sp. S32]